jgi:hypothetical protein
MKLATGADDLVPVMVGAQAPDVRGLVRGRKHQQVVEMASEPDADPAVLTWRRSVIRSLECG